MTKTALDCDVFVWGLGGMGSAAAWRLARAGARVLGCDQFGPAHDRGSSHGQTRIIRKAYFEHPDYVPLLQEAYRLWSELEQFATRPLLHPVGLFIAGAPDSVAVAGTLQAARDHGLPIEQFTAPAARARFPGFHFDDHFAVVWEAQAGFLDVEECVTAQIEAAKSLGADLRFHVPLLDWQPDEHGVTVRTATETIRAAKLVLCAGPWAGQFVPGLTVRRKPVFWFPAGPEYRLDRGAGTFFFDLPVGQFYGFPSLDGVSFKAAKHTGGEVVYDPANVDRSMRPEDVARMGEFLRQHMPAAGLAPTAHSVCLYTLTTDHHFIIDRHPDCDRVVVAAGFSGHGFKFTPVVGQALAELALNGGTDLPIRFLRWDRGN
ncbi:MAG: N-methyl-L-tryptophan oxidase [Planctomycetota bacterium]|nr:N-methyl-L-tryptophan oxidase [Planctomycetota bacterium]